MRPLRFQRNSRRFQAGTWWICLGTILGVWWLTSQPHVRQDLQQLLGWIARKGAVGIVVFLMVYVMACVLLVPGAILTIGAGTVFGFAKGIPIASMAATLGASAAFLVSRHLVRGGMKQLIEEGSWFKVIDEAVAREGWRIVCLTRLSPILPFALLNYAFGLTRVRFIDFVLASWIGMLPGAVLYVYIGSLLRSVTDIGLRNRGRSAAEWVFLTMGLAATIWVTVIISRSAKRILGEKLKAES